MASAQLRIVNWNTTGEARSGGPQNVGTIDVLEAIGLETVNGVSRPLDVLSLQEQSGGDTASIVSALNSLYGSGTYAAAPTPPGAQTSGAGLPGLIYNTTTVDLLGSIAFGSVNTSAQARSTLRYQLRPDGYTSDADFYVYSNHYKASTGGTNQARRNVEATALRANLDALGQGTSAILAGDYNIRSSSEASYQTLLAPGNGQAFDPINTPGSWHNSFAFRGVHTQSPVTSSNFGGQVTGGMDDRFDFQLVTGELIDDEGFDYIDNSYHAFGNNGTHNVNGAISTGNGASSLVLEALEQASDHLPVVADYQLPSVLFAEIDGLSSGLEFNLGEAASVDLLVSNLVDAVSATTGDELDWIYTVSGALLGSGGGTVAAAAAAASTQVLLDTTSVGAQSGFITVSSNSPGQPAGPFVLPVSFTVSEIVPEPASGLLMLCSFALMGARRRR